MPRDPSDSPAHLGDASRARLRAAAETLGSASREWWPAFLARPGGPDGRPDPADWIAADRSRRFVLDWMSPDAARPRIEPGAIVPFLWRECRSAVEVTVEPDGSFDPHGAIARDATHFWDVRDGGTVAHSLDELAMLYAEGLARPVRLRVRMCRWAVRELPFRLLVAAGRPVLAIADEGRRLAG